MFIEAEETDSVLDLHEFADASTKALGACVYAVFKTEEGIKSTLVTGKSRVTPPLKGMSIPRLERTAAELLAKFMFLKCF